MELIQVIVLALIQGLTEFLPISSSAHLILASELTGWPDQGTAFDVAVHVGSLMAVIWYFRNDVYLLLTNWLRSLVGKGQNDYSRMAWYVIIGTIPVGIIGLLAKDIIEDNLRSALVIAISTIVFGLLLWAADAAGKRTDEEDQMTWGKAGLIGIAQAMALIPGTSRSGATMTMALFLGFTRTAAARFSFLLSIPAILAAGLVKTKDLLESNSAIPWFEIGLGTTLSFIAAYACIHLFLKLLDSIGMLPFIIYRLVLGAFLLVWVM